MPPASTACGCTTSAIWSHPQASTSPSIIHEDHCRHLDRCGGGPFGRLCEYTGVSDGSYDVNRHPADWTLRRPPDGRRDPILFIYRGARRHRDGHAREHHVAAHGCSGRCHARLRDRPARRHWMCALYLGEHGGLTHRAAAAAGRRRDLLHQRLRSRSAGRRCQLCRALLISVTMTAISRVCCSVALLFCTTGCETVYFETPTSATPTPAPDPSL